MTKETNLVRPSRDGDQFHYLWAARRCLQLLKPETDLIAISIEGASNQEKGNSKKAVAGEEIIDIAEYLGSEEIKGANLVRYMQLKHSTLHSNKAWTASGFKKTLKGFSDRYKELLKEFTASELSKKLQFWFVTNRPINSNFLDAISGAAKNKASSNPKELKSVEKYTGLKGAELASFCELLHFESGEPDYWNQRNILTQDVKFYLTGADEDAPLRLKELVNRKALSEGEKNPVINKMDVLRALNIDEEDLFPAKCLIEEPPIRVFRGQESALVEQIITAKHPVVIHAPAGVGKTIFAANIGRELPKGSTCILYDCFGDGLYRNASGYRHQHKDGLVQVANELSAKSLCHLLIPTVNADSSELVRAFLYRLEQATAIVRAENPEALLCIVVDAADNAQMAAEEIGESKSFVRDLIREKVPDAVRLVFLCRTHRLDMLAPPPDAIKLELSSFTYDETASHLRVKFPDASDNDIKEFHRLSSENPRVQALALSRNLSLPDTLRLLGPNPTTVESTIGSLLEAAITSLKDEVTAIEKTQIDKMCAGLASLRPLVPISILSKISGVPEAAIKSFALDIGRPLRVAGDTIQFFDEPAETWFRETFKPSAEAFGDFISALKPIASTSAYVASVLPQLMLEGEKFQELVELVLASDALPDTSPIERRDVELQRLQFSLKAALRSKRYLAAAKLALKAGGEAAGEDRQKKILEENVDLAGAFLETGTLQEIVLRRTFDTSWRGSHHVYEASLLSCKSELIGDARSRLRLAYEWLSNWGRLSSDERKEEEISDQDISEITFALLNIYGPKAASNELGGWTPKETSYRAGRIVARRLIDHGRVKDVEDMGSSAQNNLCLALATTVELRSVQRNPLAEVAKRTFSLIANTRIDLNKILRGWDQENELLSTITAIVEAALVHKVCDKEAAISVLTRYLPKQIRGLSTRFTKSHIPILRAYCLRANLQGVELELRDLAHKELQDEIDKNNMHAASRELREFRQNIGALLPWHKLWVNALTGITTKNTLEADLEKVRKASSGFTQLYYSEDYSTTNEIAELWMEILHLLAATDGEQLDAFMKWKESLGNPLYTPTLTRLARLCCQVENTKQLAISLALEAFNLTKEDRAHAENKSDGYINAARSILAVSKADAKSYFDAAIEVASKIGDENLSRWTAILDIAECAAKSNSAVPKTAYRFARCAELTYEHVDRDKHFPWRDTISVLCDLCPSSSLAIISRWRDRRFGWSEKILPYAIERLVEKKHLSPLQVVPLVGYKARWEYADILCEAINTSSKGDDKSKIADYVFSYARYHLEDFSAFKKEVDKFKVPINGLDECIAARENPKPDAPATGTEEAVTLDGYVEQDSRDWNKVFENYDLTNANGLKKSYDAFRSTESPWYDKKFFEEAIKRVIIGTETSFILAVSEVPQFELYSLREFLEAIPANWKSRPAIVTALADMLKIFCRRYCMGISKNRYYEVLPFKMACELTGVKEVELVDVVLNAVGDTNFPADANRLFSLVGLIGYKLSDDEAHEALNFGLEFYTPLLENKDGDGEWSDTLNPPADILMSLAGYVWATLASPSPVIRWEGAHVVKGIAAFGLDKVLKHLMSLASEQKGVPFVDSKLPFYSLHALQWLLISLARTAKEYPKALKLFGQQILDLALAGTPHLTIQLFAARTCLELISAGELTVDDLTRKKIELVGKSPFTPIESKSSERYKLRYKADAQEADDEVEEEEDRYSFSMDFGPYWYAPLGEVFAMSQVDIEKAALKVIRTNLAAKTSGRWDEDPRSKMGIYKEGLSYHSHGSYPRVDNLHFYHSYHAMMMVAGNLIASIPVHRDSDYGSDDELADWINRHDISRRDGWWLWDRRDFFPANTSVLGKVEKNVSDAFTQADFENALWVGDELNLYGTWTEADNERQRSLSISSALVPPDKSSSLLRALNDTPNPYDFLIPDADNRLEIDESGFYLKGWITHRTVERGLDNFDRWAGGVGFPPPVPSDQIKNLMSIVTDKENRTWRDNKNNIVMSSKIWGHYDEGDRDEISNPMHGNRLVVDRKFAAAMLKELGSELIISVKLDQRKRYRYHERGDREDDQRIKSTARTFILGQDGKVRSA